jgi:hypothetical protein
MNPIELNDFLNEVLNELQYRTNEGVVDLKNPTHISLLSEILHEYGMGDLLNELEPVNKPENSKDDEYSHQGNGVYVKKGDEGKDSAAKFKKDDNGNYKPMSDAEANDVKQQAGDDGGSNNNPEGQPEDGSKAEDDGGGEGDGGEEADVPQVNVFSDKEYQKKIRDFDKAAKEDDTSTKGKSNVSTDTREKIKISEALKENLKFILENRESTRLKSGGGSNSPTVDEIIALQTFTTERMNQDTRRAQHEEKGLDFDEEPYVHPNIKQRVVEDNVLDESLDYLKDNLDDDSYQKLIKRFATGGAVPTHLTKLTKLKKSEYGYPGFDTNSVGYKRAREIIRLYLKNDGKSPVTGKPLPLSHMEPDHRLPFTTSDHELIKAGDFPGLSLKPKYPPDGNSLQEIQKKRKTDRNDYENNVLEALEPLQAKYDDPTNNMDLLSGPVNQFKGSLINDKLLNSIRKKLLQNPEEKRLQDEYTTERKTLLSKHHMNRVANGDNPPYHEYQIRNADKVETNAMMKAHNYYHPDARVLTTYINGVPDKNIKPDPDYYDNLRLFWEKKGVELPAGVENVDFNQHPFNKAMTVYVQAGRGRGGAKRRTEQGDHDYMVNQFKEYGYYGSSYEEDQGQEAMLNDARVRMNKKIDAARIKVLKVQLADPNLEDPSRKRDNRQAELDKLMDKQL